MMYPTKWVSITYGYHQGKSLDFGWCGHRYQDILACDDGIVYQLENQPTGGKCIYIKHNSGIVSLYAHLNTIDVKKGQQVRMGTKIGTMGDTGSVYNKSTKQYEKVAMHLHFGLYSVDKVKKGFNASGLHGTSDIDPFKYLEVYPMNDITNVASEFKKLMKVHKETLEWTPGDYRLLYSKAVRKSPNCDNDKNIQIVGLLKAFKKYCVEKGWFQKAHLKVGTEVLIDSIVIDDKSRVWGKSDKYYICLCNMKGEAQAEKI